MKTSLVFFQLFLFASSILAQDPALNWKEGKLEPPQNEGYKMQKSPKSLDEDQPEYQDLEAEETDETQVELEESEEIDHESLLKEPEVAITGRFF